ncbi:TIGR00153 family protein [Candidatus Bathyarchaeota archaeon]|nr:MAG: TIGR00153 family protein [Candidatus Bathyarchaeota archaeon]
MRFVRSVMDVFGYSPFKALRAHSELCGKAIGLLQKQFEAYKKGNYEEVERLKEKIDEIEDSGDLIKREIRANVTKSLILPVDKHDLLEFILTQDEILNNCEVIGSMLTYRKIQADGEVWCCFEVLLSKIMEAVNNYEEMMGKIQDLITSSFNKREIERTISYVPEILKLEKECKSIQVTLNKKLFGSNKLNILDVLLLTQIAMKFGDVASYITKAAERFRAMLLSR